MKIQNLASTPVEEVISCFLTAFENYFVPLPQDPAYWKSRFVTARVDWHLSFGMFYNDKLIGFIINGVDNHNGHFTAYNTGTGVVPEFRGRAVVDKLYAHALPLLRQKGIKRCLLEVICENEKAIKVYERIGFSIVRKFESYSGKLPGAVSKNSLQKCHFSEVIEKDLDASEHYSWDNSAGAIKRSEDKIQTYCIQNAPEVNDYFVIDDTGNILQLESRTGEYHELLAAAGTVALEVKLKNVDSGRRELIGALEKLNFLNTVNQYEMEMML